MIPNARYYLMGTYELKNVLAFFFICGGFREVDD